MRWSYKTVHFELKKEGLLGSTFLDESEIEQSLNEYGRSGWELMSMLETRDGLIAIFKQPLDISSGGFQPQKRNEIEDTLVLSSPAEVLPQQDIGADKVEKRATELADDKKAEQQDTATDATDIGAIRIE